MSLTPWLLLATVLSTASSICAQSVVPPDRVDTLKVLGLTAGANPGPIAALKDGPVALLLGPNLRGRIEHMRRFKQEVGGNSFLLRSYGGNEVLEVSTDIYSSMVLPFAEMLKSQFADIRVTQAISGPADSPLKGTVIAEMHVKWLGGDASLYWAQLLFLVPSGSRSIYRDLQVSFERSCGGSNEARHRCYANAEKQLFSQLKEKLEASMQN